MVEKEETEELEDVGDEDRIIGRIRAYLEEKEGLDLHSCYFISKRLNEAYWDDISLEGESDEQENDLEVDDDLGPLEGLEETPEEEEVLEVAVPVEKDLSEKDLSTPVKEVKPPSKVKGKIFVKKPRIKEKAKEEKEEDPGDI